MMRSLFSGVSGLRVHQTRMDVIGHNIANVNTVGFKSGRVTFQEVFSQTLRGASSPDTSINKGGTNPMAVGLGVNIGSIDNIMTGGSMQRTDYMTDVAIEGDGFFIVKLTAADTYKFTRAGNFEKDKLGNINLNGYSVYGWQKAEKLSDGTWKFDTELPLEPINVYQDAYRNKRILDAQATTYAKMAGNLNSNADIATNLPISYPVTTTSGTGGTEPDAAEYTLPMVIYDSLGNDYRVDVKFWKTGVNVNQTDPTQNYTEWTYQIPPIDGFQITSTTTGLTSLTGGALEGTLRFNSVGHIISTGVNSAPDSKPHISITPAPTGTNPGGGTTATTAPTAMEIDFDFSKISMFSDMSAVEATDINGYTMGELVTFNIGTDGVFTGLYSNGQQQPLAMLGLAVFNNPAGLQKTGENMFIPTANSGDFVKAVRPGSAKAGQVKPGNLEMSNVDLSREFTDMIITQRGFQANSRIITTSDEMLQELVNLKR